jgi:hypothetical protein
MFHLTHLLLFKALEVLFLYWDLINPLQKNV